MFISVIHRISDPEAFRATAASAANDIPHEIKLHQSVTSNDRSTAICLWEAASVDDVRNLLEPLLGRVSKNEYVPIDPASSMGLPTPSNVTA